MYGKYSRNPRVFVRSCGSLLCVRVRVRVCVRVCVCVCVRAYVCVIYVCV